jgi:hypothetical protein
MGGSALAVGGGAPLLTASITAKPDPITPDSHPSTLHGRPHRTGPDRAWTWTDADRLAWTWTVGRRVARDDAEAQGSAGKRNASSALRHATPCIGHASTGHATLERRRTAHNRRGRGKATLGRPDARMRHGAGYARAGEACTILHPSGHKKARVTLRCPGFACLGSNYRRKMRIKSAASRDPSDPRSGRRQNGPGLNRLRHSAE